MTRLDVAVERRGEQQPLPVARGLAENLGDLLHEAHLRHVVGLVEHRDLHVGELRVALPREVR